MNEIFLDDKSIILTNVQENIENEKYDEYDDGKKNRHTYSALSYDRP